MKKDPRQAPQRGTAEILAGWPVLWRRNHDMAITVRADVKDGEPATTTRCPTSW